ncbi:MAG: DUF1441 family protein [Serratia symbiotica]|nr:DUF1441 family protein [Serratia symbiotica]
MVNSPDNVRCQCPISAIWGTPTTVKGISQVLDTWPDKLERDRGWIPAQIAEAQDAVDEMREMLAVEVVTIEEEDGE